MEAPLDCWLVISPLAEPWLVTFYRKAHQLLVVFCICGEKNDLIMNIESLLRVLMMNMFLPLFVGKMEKKVKKKLSGQATLVESRLVTTLIIFLPK